MDSFHGVDLKPEDHEEISRRITQMNFEDTDSLLPETIDRMITATLTDFQDIDEMDETAKYAARIAAESITGKTRAGHARKRKSDWSPMTVTAQTPSDIISYITQKCGRTEDGFEGKKYATAEAIRAALTLWFRHLRPGESTVEWRQDPMTEKWLGLPTRSRMVVDFMTGLEKQKAKSGEVSQSARALTLDDIHHLYDHLVARPDLDVAERRKGIIRYAAYLLGWLLMLRIDETLSLEFESVNKIPGERRYLDVRLIGTRKTAQAGVGHFWRLHANDEDPRICPLRILALLAVIYKVNVKRSGPLFLQTNMYGAVLQEKPITSGILSRSLANDMRAIGSLSWHLYGTHSFRRGGCQYRVKVKGWTVDMVAAWGGWSQLEAVTMFRYFYSPNDNHDYMAEYDRNDVKRSRYF